MNRKIWNAVGEIEDEFVEEGSEECASEYFAARRRRIRRVFSAAACFVCLCVISFSVCVNAFGDFGGVNASPPDGENEQHGVGSAMFGRGNA